MPHKIGLGTVQFGLDYGVANTAGRPEDGRVAAILETAWQGGVRLLDTAPAYGDSESRIAACRPSQASFGIVSKTLPGCTPAELRSTLEESLEHLGVPSLHGLLLHDPADLVGDGADARLAAMVKARDDGLVNHIGASVYEAAQASQAIKAGVLDIIQLPVSILDRRLLRDGTLGRLKEAGFEVHARSVFLQGLLLMEPDAIPSHVSAARAGIEAVRAAAARDGWSPLEAAVGFVHALDAVDALIVGVDRAEQLDAILAAATATSAGGFDLTHFDDLGLDDPNVVNPSNWETP